MFKIKTKKFRKITVFFKKIPRILGENAFLACLIFFIIAMILGGLVLYRYNILAEQKEPEFLEKPFYFDEKGLQKILEIWRECQMKFDQVDSREYLNPFKVD